MRTLVDIDDELMRRAMKATGIKQKKALVTYSLKEVLRKKKLERLLARKGRGDVSLDLRGLERMRRSA